LLSSSKNMRFSKQPGLAAALGRSRIQRSRFV
jgi:hypothetical protein